MHHSQKMLRSIPDFYALTLLHEDFIPYDKKWEGTWPKMLLYALDELFHVIREVGVNAIDGQCVVAHEILSLASLPYGVARQAHRSPQDHGDSIYFGGCA